MSFCNFNSKSDGRRYDFFLFHLNTALPFPVQNLVQRLSSQTPSRVSSTPSEVSAIPCELFGNTLRNLVPRVSLLCLHCLNDNGGREERPWERGCTLRALFMKNREVFYNGEIFLPNTRGPLGCLLRFWPFGPKPCGGNSLEYTNGE